MRTTLAHESEIGRSPGGGEASMEPPRPELSEERGLVRRLCMTLPKPPRPTAELSGERRCARGIGERDSRGGIDEIEFGAVRQAVLALGEPPFG